MNKPVVLITGASQHRPRGGCRLCQELKLQEVTSWIDTFRPPHADQGSGPDIRSRSSATPTASVVRARAEFVADTRAALTLSEANYAAVQYIPRKDVDMTLLERTDRATYWPLQGGLRLLQRSTRGERSVNAVWTYEILIRQSCGSKTTSPSIPIGRRNRRAGGKLSAFNLSAPCHRRLAGHGSHKAQCARRHLADILELSPYIIDVIDIYLHDA